MSPQSYIRGILRMLLLSLFLVFSLFNVLYSVNLAKPSALDAAPKFGSDFTWQRICPEDEEFSTLLPLQPTVTREHSRHYTYKAEGERVLRHIAYSGYVKDLGFVIESYQAANPERLFVEMNEPFKVLPLLEEQQKSGFATRKYRWQVDFSVGEVYVFTARSHLYVLTVVSRQTDPALARIFSSFSLESCQRTAIDVTQPQKIERYVPNNEKIYSQKEVDQKAIVVFRSKPQYTEEALQRGKKGVVILNGILSTSGKVIVLDVVKSVKYGLTEAAIASVNNLVFLPAKKNGESVSVRMTLEYHFNLY